MRPTYLRRALALFLCCQPVLWKSNVALAQSLQPGLSIGPTAPDRTQPEPFSALEGLEAPRAERAPVVTAISPAVPALPPVDAAMDPDAYVCGPGDVFELNFWGLQNFKLRSTIDLEGRAFVAKVGYFDLKGKTLSQARRVIREEVAHYYPRLSFDLVLAEPRTFMVQVVDAVGKPGSYPARAVDRLATIVARAGGLASNGSKRRIEIRRRDGQILHPDLVLFGLTGDVKHNPYLLDGDVVRVPFEDLAATITGGVNRPGRYELVGARDLPELLSLAGGLAPNATQLLPVSVVSRLPDDRQDQKLVPFAPDGTPPPVPLRREDAVRIPVHSELQRSVTVIGAIAGAQVTRGKTGDATASAPEETSSTRRLPFVEGDSVRTLLDRVGGVGPLADLDRSYILRKGVPVPVNLHALLMLKDLTADRPIELDDTLVVPFKRRNILIEGAVFKPGEYPYNPTFGIDQYLSLAGGRNRSAVGMSDVRVVSPTGQMTPYKTDLRVDPGSTLVVPERSFSRAEVVSIALAIASIVLTGATLVITAKK
jgi:protein involved in polysaccharide export with SLBB domain